MFGLIFTCRPTAVGWLSIFAVEKSQENLNSNFALVRGMYAPFRIVITFDNPERKTAIVSSFFRDHNLDIVALSETRFPGESQLVEVGGGYTFYWRGRSEDEVRQSGVGFAIKTSIAKNLYSLPKGISDRIMTLRLSIGKDRWATLISVYAPTMTNEEDNILEFYNQLNSTLSNIPHHDKIILLGDFNARVGNESTIWSGVLGNFGIGSMNF